jgi:hypothetical protein
VNGRTPLIRKTASLAITSAMGFLLDPLSLFLNQKNVCGPAAPTSTVSMIDAKLTLLTRSEAAESGPPR